MTYRITVTFSLKKGNKITKYKSCGLYLQRVDVEPLSKESLAERAKAETLEIVTKDYPGHMLASGLKVTIKQMHVNFVI